LFSGDDNKIRDTIILCSNQVNEPIKIGYMLRMQLRFSRDGNNQRSTSTGGKYDVLRGSFTNSTITGTVYGLPAGIEMHEIVSGASFTGPITLTRKNTATVNTSDYVN
ncbi:MAG: hypothetical protein PHT95_04040, partial [Candidatus Omnitrophica bacterium]|nr:hypothetical protein [Candidatus Omnitrophota bacterium]